MMIQNHTELQPLFLLPEQPAAVRGPERREVEMVAEYADWFRIRFLDRRGCLYDYLMYNLHLFLNE